MKADAWRAVDHRDDCLAHARGLRRDEGGPRLADEEELLHLHARINDDRGQDMQPSPHVDADDLPEGRAGVCEGGFEGEALW